MNLVSYRRKSSIADAMLMPPCIDQIHDLEEITELADRFRYAHARLNDIELELHDHLQSGDRFNLLRCLEEARMEYSDARFALSTRNIISSRR